MTDEAVIELINRELLTCGVCGKTMIKLTEYWGCPYGPSHTALMSDAQLDAKIDDLVPGDTTKPKRKWNPGANCWDEVLDGREVQLKRLMRKLHIGCGAKLPNLATATCYRHFYEYAMHDGPTRFYLEPKLIVEKGCLVAWDGHADVVHWLMHWEMKHVTVRLQGKPVPGYITRSGFLHDESLINKAESLGITVLQ